MNSHISQTILQAGTSPVAMENLSGMVFRRLHNEGRSFIYVSKGCYKLTGYSPDELLRDGGCKYFSLIRPGYIAATSGVINSAVEEKSGYEISYQINKISGEACWVLEEGFPVYNDSGACVYIEGIIRDITKTRQLESSLRFSNTRLKLLNDIARELVGKSPLHEMVNKMLSEIVNVFEVDAGIVRVISKEGLILLTQLNVPEKSVLPILPVDKGLAGKMISEKSPVVIKNTFLDPVTIPMLNRHSNEFKFISFAGAPLIVQETVIGVIGLYTVKAERVFTEEDLNQLQIAANHIGAAIENNRLFTDLEKKKAELEVQIEVRKETEAALFESQSKLDMIISSVNLVLYQRSAKRGEFQYVSPAIETITGYSPAEIKNIVWDKLIIKTENFTPYNKKPAATDKIRPSAGEFKADYLLRRKDGSLCWITDHSYPWYDTSGKLIGSIGVLTDITERKSFEKQIKEEKSKSQQLMDNSPVAIALLNTNGVIVAANDAFCMLFKYEKADIYNKNIDDLITPPDYKEEGRNLCREATCKKAVVSESLRRKSTGELVFVQIAGVPVESEGENKALYAIYIDLTERLMAEEEIRAAKNKAEEANRIKSSFLANMSHELRTPLIGVLGFSEMLKEEAKDEQTRTIAEKINKGGVRLLENLNLILDISRVESGKIEVAKQLIKINKIVEEVVDLFSKAADKKGLYIRCINNASPEILTDPKLTRQIFNNLVNNAIKFTQTGGITILTSTDERRVKIEIQDTGVGIAEHDQKIIWEEFRQASEGFGRTFEGTGLGLSITKKFVHMLGGVIYLNSTPGEGSTFTVELPLDPKPIKRVAEKK